MDADGSGARELVRNTSQLAYPHFSPDSRWVRYLTEDDSGKMVLWKVPVEGGERVRVSDRYIRTVTPSPDGKQLAAARGAKTYDFVLIQNLK